VEAEVAFGVMALIKVLQTLEALEAAVVAETVQLVAMELRVKVIMAVMPPRVREQVTIAQAVAAGLGLLAVTLQIMKVVTVAMGCTATSQER
jgi:hypothetical protein